MKTPRLILLGLKVQKVTRDLGTQCGLPMSYVVGNEVKTMRRNHVNRVKSCGTSRGQNRHETSHKKQTHVCANSVGVGTFWSPIQIR